MNIQELLIKAKAFGNSFKDFFMVALKDGLIASYKSNVLMGNVLAGTLGVLLVGSIALSGGSEEIVKVGSSANTEVTAEANVNDNFPFGEFSYDGIFGVTHSEITKERYTLFMYSSGEKVVIDHYKPIGMESFGSNWPVGNLGGVKGGIFFKYKEPIKGEMLKVYMAETSPDHNGNIYFFVEEYVKNGRRTYNTYPVTFK